MRERTSKHERGSMRNNAGAVCACKMGNETICLKNPGLDHHLAGNFLIESSLQGMQLKEK